jgi:hypothetical protein
MGTETMEDTKITVTWDELNSRMVETRLKEQKAMERNRAYAQLDADAVPETTGPSKPHLIYNSMIYMAAFGILGGLLAWGTFVALQFKPSTQAEAADLIHEMQKVTAARDTGRSTAEEADDALALIKADGASNPYFLVDTDSSLSESLRDTRIAELENRDRQKEFIVNVLIFGICGMWIAACLSVAEPLTQRNYASALTNGSVAALLGLLGGLASAMFVYVMRQNAGERNLSEATIQILSWGVLGLFLVAGAGVVMRNPKKLVIGMAGGLLGGLIGGAVFEPVRAMTDSVQDSNLIAFMAIGAVAGIGTGLIENATRKAWLRVIAGVLAGKQFILYRNPTFIGSAPDCQIYLFKDQAVGPRHAAIHITPGAYELEDLPLGQKTMINQKPISKVRLRHGDRITVGSTVFLFQDRTS